MLKETLRRREPTAYSSFQELFWSNIHPSMSSLSFDVEALKTRFFRVLCYTSLSQDICHFYCCIKSTHQLSWISGALLSCSFSLEERWFLVYGASATTQAAFCWPTWIDFLLKIPGKVRQHTALITVSFILVFKACPRWGGGEGYQVWRKLIRTLQPTLE